MTGINTELAISFMSGIIVPFTIWYLKHRSDKRKEKSKDSLKEEIEFSNTICNKLETIKKEYKADRIWLAQFHNGGHFYPTGKSIQKFSMIYEIVGPSITSTQHQFQNIPVNLFARSMNQLFENDYIYMNDVKDTNIPDYGLKAISEENKTKSQYLYAVRNIEGRFIGMMGIEYTKSKTLLSNEELNELLVESATLGGVLMSHLNTR